MPGVLAALTMLLLVSMVVARVLWMKRNGMAAMQFGKIDKTDFVIPPFAFFYFYLVFAHAFHWPTVSTHAFFQSKALPWIGVLFCLVGLALFLWSLVSFGQSFRLGIDTDHPNRLVTTGAFAVTRNPIYVALGIILLGQFLVFPNFFLLVYWLAAAWLIHRQVLREEDYLVSHYGAEYAEYCRRVRRYV